MYHRIKSYNSLLKTLTISQNISNSMCRMFACVYLMYFSKSTSENNNTTNDHWQMVNLCVVYTTRNNNKMTINYNKVKCQKKDFSVVWKIHAACAVYKYWFSKFNWCFGVTIVCNNYCTRHFNFFGLVRTKKKWRYLVVIWLK